MMYPPDEYMEFLSAISGASDKDGLLSVLKGALEPYGLKNLAYIGTSGRKPLSGHDLSFIATYKQAWIDRYQEKRFYEVDPVLSLAGSGTLVSDWDDLFAQVSSKVMLGEAREHGVGEKGLSLSVRGSHSDWGIFTATADASGADWNKLKLFYAKDFHTVAYMVHHKIITLDAATRSKSPLAPRELECVRALAKGVPAKMIAYELGISLSAVRLYLTMARKKLGCGNLNHLIAKAASSGLLDAPHPQA